MKTPAKIAIRRLVCVSIALSFLLGVFGLSFLTATSNDLVYCPLQNAWVERNPEQKSRSVIDLDDMCAAERLKSSFVSTVTRSYRVETDQNPEVTFWNYVADVSGDLPSQPTAPDILQVGKSPFATARQQNHPALDIEQILATSLFARPPTDEKQLSLTYRRLTDQELTLGSTQPRAPPVS